MREKTFFRLQSSEAAISQMASRIMAAYITTGLVRPGNEADYLEKSVDMALDLARRVDDLVESDDEMGEEK
jgi:hypothetical protein